MKISEIFYSIQGEGSLAGVPSVFVRTSDCNLRCVWCDTPYTSWNPEGDELTLDGILEKVAAFQAGFAVVTGGEPMIAPGIVELTHRLRDQGMHVTVETAGTVFAEVACDLISVSPKLSNSTPPGRFAAQHERLRIQPGILSRLIATFDYQLKFVIAKPDDVAEAVALAQQLGADNRKVILMPEGVDATVLRERSVWLAEICKKQGFRYGPRLHVDLYGNRRGT
ncbi:MAG: 7-carboxy-7-deazaguanine synthase QueE [Acidobacteriota bacterium]|nr:7-carboxy-7-deazaguanine synthase QueE [Acidobacteriota bacterium]